MQDISKPFSPGRPHRRTLGDQQPSPGDHRVLNEKQLAQRWGISQDPATLAQRRS